MKAPPKKKPDEAGGAANRRALSKKQQRQFSPKSTATEAQIFRALSMLRLRPRHTYELRAQGISHPAQRIKDLVRLGYKFQSDRITSVDSDAFTHRGVALYSLICEPEGAA